MSRDVQFRTNADVPGIWTVYFAGTEVGSIVEMEPSTLAVSADKKPYYARYNTGGHSTRAATVGEAMIWFVQGPADPRAN